MGIQGERHTVTRVAGPRERLADTEAELACEEGLTDGEYPIWSPWDAHEAAATLLQLLEQDKHDQNSTAKA